jgi:hypothetical protein
MATFTFRIPNNMAGRLSSAAMRSRLTQFLRNPHSLPPDPGSGYERTSLTLPGELVQQAGGFLRCSPSAALRRIAAERLGAQQTRTVIQMNPPVRPPVISAPRAAQIAWSPDPAGRRNPARDTSGPGDATGAMIASFLIQILILGLIFGIGIFFRSRKANSGKPA